MRLILVILFASIGEQESFKNKGFILNNNYLILSASTNKYFTFEFILF
jgi:hypothetical protein